MKEEGGIYPGKRRKSYYRRILAFCQEEVVAVPNGFHTRDAYNYAVLDIGGTPHSLIAVTWYLESWVIDYLNSRLAHGRTFRILDFDKCRELKYDGGKKLTIVGPFNCHKETDYVY
ncbi:hypothetical protein FACS1894116_05040 [Betaproteobacteria bacterium]|nr:hypothetical protein FACS1894116_05040 [Betaproteobacteria bacterium]GHT97502.1 hypothetical protein FACS1894154_01010 [Betaproteobacteria bacterium]GHU21989.1 hypothetical protein FACS189488_01640 [Betaproteobacteria bacterium]